MSDQDRTATAPVSVISAGGLTLLQSIHGERVIELTLILGLCFLSLVWLDQQLAPEGRVGGGTPLSRVGARCTSCAGHFVLVWGGSGQRGEYRDPAAGAAVGARWHMVCFARGADRIRASLDAT
jgi:hypothetical protein